MIWSWWMPFIYIYATQPSSSATTGFYTQISKWVNRIKNSAKKFMLHIMMGTFHYCDSQSTLTNSAAFVRIKQTKTYVHPAPPPPRLKHNDTEAHWPLCCHDAPMQHQLLTHCCYIDASCRPSREYINPIGSAWCIHAALVSNSAGLHSCIMRTEGLAH